MLEAIQISKTFPGVKALDNVSLTFFPGQVNALLGENGAGKSTLLKILTGVYTGYEGEIRLNGRSIRFDHVREAQDAGIAIIHQELNLIPQMTITENIFLGRELHTPLGFLDRKAMRRQSLELIGKLNLEVTPETPVNQLRVGEQQLVEIAKALLTNASIILMDEPTSALSDTEIQNLHRIVLDLRSAGKTIVYISHKMEELFRIADRYAVLRDGQMVGAGKMEATGEQDLIRLMVGRDVQVTLADSAPLNTPTLLKVSKLSLQHPTLKGRKLLDQISFSLKEGEILGIFGLMGAGRTELLQTLFGMHPAKSTFELELNGEPCRIASPRDAIQSGLAFVTEDRKAQGLVLGMNITENINMTNPDPYRILHRKREQKLARQYIEQLKIKTPSADQRCRNLSGGNQQKVVLAKWLATNPRVLFMDEPTRGIDINAKSEIYTLMKKLVADKLGIILVSSEIPEILAVADRILVLSEGRITATFSAGNANEDQLLKAALPN